MGTHRQGGGTFGKCEGLKEATSIDDYVLCRQVTLERHRAADWESFILGSAETMNCTA